MYMVIWLILVIHHTNPNSYQHRGFGHQLMKEAEKITKNEFNLRKLSVISAVGTRSYYKKLGYTQNGPYVTKILK